jgi:hypothetical protein
MKALVVSPSVVRIMVSVGILCGLVWNATASTVFGDDLAQKGTCRIHIQETIKKGENKVKKNVDVSDVELYSRADCKSEALMRKISSESKEDVVQVKVYFSFREPAIVR